MQQTIPEPGSGQPGARDLATELRVLHQSYRRQDLRRFARYWWPRMVLVVLGGCLGAVLGVIGVFVPLIAIGAVLAPVFVVLMVKRLGVAWVVLGVCASPLMPPAFTVKSLTFYPVEFALVLLLVAVAVRVVPHARSFVLPSFWTIWPQIGLIALAIMSELLIQVLWLPQVPRRLNSQPVIYSEVLGVAIYVVPLLIIVVTTTCLTRNEQWIPRLLNVILVLSAMQALLVCVEFKRIGADVYSFRYQEPSILYMHLNALAQFMGIGAAIACARALVAERWRVRLAYGALTAFYVLAIFFTLENARWIAVAVALAVIVFVYSRRLFALCCACCVPLIPVAISVVFKVAETKGSYDVNRLSIWGDMIRIWWKRPLLGVGPGNVWPFDQTFTQLPLQLRNLNATGLGVAHDGALQALVEVGPLGVLFYFASAVVVALAAWRLYRRASGPNAQADKILALACLGVVVGSLCGDLVSGDFFRPAAQIGGFNDLPRTFITWMLFGIILYKDQIWRTSRRLARVAALSRGPARVVVVEHTEPQPAR